MTPGAPHPDGSPPSPDRSGGDVHRALLAVSDLVARGERADGLPADAPETEKRVAMDLLAILGPVLDDPVLSQQLARDLAQAARHVPGGS